MSMTRRSAGRSWRCSPRSASPSISTRRAAPNSLPSYYRANYRTSFFLFGWTPTTYDALDMLTNLAATPDPAAHAGDFNFGGYSNRALDALIARIEVETERGQRLALLREALKLLQDDIAYHPAASAGCGMGGARRRRSCAARRRRLSAALRADEIERALRRLRQPACHRRAKSGIRGSAPPR